jgi:hypothetical protein
VLPKDNFDGPQDRQWKAELTQILHSNQCNFPFYTLPADDDAVVGEKSEMTQCIGNATFWRALAGSWNVLEMSIPRSRGQKTSDLVGLIIESQTVPLSESTTNRSQRQRRKSTKAAEAEIEEDNCVDNLEFDLQNPAPAKLPKTNPTPASSDPDLQNAMRLSTSDVDMSDMSTTASHSTSGSEYGKIISMLQQLQDRLTRVEENIFSKPVASPGPPGMYRSTGLDDLFCEPRSKFTVSQ